MNLLEALEKKRALESVLEDLIDDLGSSAHDLEKLSDALTSVDELVDEIFRYERGINKHYQETRITKTDSISDAFTHVNALNKKIETLKYLLLEVNRKELLTGIRSEVNQQAVLSSIQNYDSMKSDLLSKIKDVCLITQFVDGVS